MRNKNRLQEKPSLQQRLRFFAFTLGGVGLEGSFLPVAQQEAAKKKARNSLA